MPGVTDEIAQQRRDYAEAVAEGYVQERVYELVDRLRYDLKARVLPDAKLDPRSDDDNDSECGCEYACDCANQALAVSPEEGAYSSQFDVPRFVCDGRAVIEACGELAIERPRTLVREDRVGELLALDL